MTIAAIATANAAGGIGIVRISGSKSIEIAEKFFAGKPVRDMKSHTMHLGKIVKDGAALDSVLICVFKAPHSYTGEDTVEIYCHGGIYVCRMVLDLVISSGARHAEPGEFTRTAFINGRIDLTQAEAVADIISANTADSVIVAANQLDKKLSQRIDKIRESLINSTGHLLATIDFSEEGIPELDYSQLEKAVTEAANRIDMLLRTAEDGRIIKDGINAVIAGAPNVGKSSLLNAISGQDKAIVTDVAGTTRDVVESQVNIRGCKLNLFDTAGIRESDDIVEKIGVERSKNATRSADLIFFVVDGSQPLGLQDEQVITMLDKSKTVCLINKTDLPRQIMNLPEFSKTIEISATKGEGLDELFEYIGSRFKMGDITQRVIITNPRHKNSLLEAQNILQCVLASFERGMPFDIILSDIELAISALGEISGMTVSDEIIDNIFENFCVGK